LTRDQSLKAIKIGSGICYAFAGFFLIFGIIGNIYNFQSEVIPSQFNDPWIFLIVLFWIFCAYCISKKIKSIAIIAFVYYLIDRMIALFENLAIQQIILAGAILYFFGKTIQGVFVFHKLEKLENPSYRSFSWIDFICAVLVIIIIGETVLHLLDEYGIISYQ